MPATASPAMAPTTSADAIPMTDEQKFLFDLKGWLLVPDVLDQGMIEALKEHATLLKQSPKKLAPEDRYSYSGPAVALLDHPAIVGILRTIIGQDVTPEAYGFRCDASFVQFRTTGDEGVPPHGGGPLVGPPSAYEVKNQQIYSGLTRVVWELTDVEKGTGGTLLMSGSHKANFHVPKEHLKRDSWAFETYDCAAGSVLFFTENLCHSGARWNAEYPRIAVFNAYTSHQAQYHKMRWDPAAIATMPKKRQTLFRGVWSADFQEQPPLRNSWYGEDNRAY